jgi:hypothetical protein
MNTIRELISREQEALAAQTARRTALAEALSSLGRMQKAGGAEFTDRAVKVRTDLAVADGAIARHESKIRELEAEQAEDDRVDALAEQTILVPASDSPAYPAYRERLDAAVARREAIERAV